ncbi:MAG: phage holin family protein [Opitutus sp.]
MVRASDSIPASAGLLGSIRGLADGLLDSARDRLELFSLELHEEKFRVIQLFIWISAAIFSAILAITFVSLTVVYLFWDSARLAVLGGFAVLYTGGCLGILLYCRKFIARQPRPFQSTIAELRQDSLCIRPQN